MFIRQSSLINLEEKNKMVWLIQHEAEHQAFANYVNSLPTSDKVTKTVQTIIEQQAAAQSVNSNSGVSNSGAGIFSTMTVTGLTMLAGSTASTPAMNDSSNNIATTAFFVNTAFNKVTLDGGNSSTVGTQAIGLDCGDSTLSRNRLRMDGGHIVYL